MKLKHLFFTLATIVSFTTAQAQVKVGANPGTINGGSALEIEASDKGLLMPRVVLTNTTTWGLSGTAVAGMSVYNTSSVVGSTNAAYPATGVGEYYWDGTGWVSKKGGVSQLGADNGLTVGYNSAGNVGLGGALSKNTIVAQGTNTLAFTSTATSGTSHFTVDGATFNVDALNGRVSINNLVPKSFLHISTKTAGASIDAGIFSIDNCGGSCDQGTARNIVLNNTNGTNDLFASLDFVPSIDPTAPSGASIQGIDRNLADLTTNYAGLAFFTRNATNYAPRMVVKSSGNVGIGTTSPTQMLDVNGSARVRVIDQSTSTSDVTLVADNNGVIKKKVDQVKGIFRSYLASDFTTGTDISSIYKITNHNEVDDPNSDFNTSTSTFTAPITGLYKVTMTVTNAKLASVTSIPTNYVVGIATTSTNNWVARFSISADYVLGSSTTVGSTSTFSGFVQLTQGQSVYFGATGGIKIIANPSGGTGTGIGTMFEVQLVKN